MPESIAKYNIEDNNKHKSIAAFDCRGLEPVDFSPRNGWRVSCLANDDSLTYRKILQVSGWKEDEDGEGRESGTLFEDVDLSEGDWADYDERSGESTMISEIDVKFVPVK